MTYKCVKCNEVANNATQTLCNTHIDELRAIYQENLVRHIKSLFIRGPILEQDNCDHDAVHNQHCYDCGLDAYEGICPMCQEHTDSLNSCCGKRPHEY